MKAQHIEEYKKYGAIRDIDAIFDTKTYNPRTFPEAPFDYLHLIREKGLLKLDPENYGKEVAIIGAGCAGLCAAYELMQLGLRPVIYEASDRIGGRTYTYRFDRDPKAYAEIGAMRIPKGYHPLVHDYMDRFGLKLIPFPSPLKVPTTIYFDQKRYDVPAGSELPPEIQPVADRWDALMQEVTAPLFAAKGDPVKYSEEWAKLVDAYQHKSIFQVLYENNWPKETIDQFGSIGAGGAPFGPFYHQVSFVEPLRVVSSGWWGEVEQIVGGIDQIPLRFWDTPAECLHWGKTSVKDLNYGEPRAGVTNIETTPDGIYLTDADGNLDKYDAVISTCTPRNLEMSINVNRSTFSEEVWNAIRNMYMIPGGRIAVRTKPAFWKERPELLRTGALRCRRPGRLPRRTP
ncbi:MAG: NAD(P)/FAD-dependent oxidoreductase [Bacteroidota bacterium]